MHKVITIDKYWKTTPGQGDIFYIAAASISAFSVYAVSAVTHAINDFTPRQKDLYT